MNRFSRLELQLGKIALDRLSKVHVAVFGLGGVGGYVTEALVRSGIGEISIFDDDIVCITNFNRQIIATNHDIGKAKVDVFEKRILSINENIIVHKYPLFVLPSNINDIPFKSFDYIIDAIDTISTKIALISKAKELNIPIISSMGAANKVDPQGFIVSDISKTSVDPLAKVIRYELKKRNIQNVKVVYSKEIPIKTHETLNEDCKYENICGDKCDNHSNKKVIPSSNAFVPASMGLLIASEVIKDLTK